MIAQVAIVTANTETALYTLTAADDLYISGIHACNPNATACTFSLAIKPTGAEAFAKAVLDMGLYLSFSGIVTFKNAKEKIVVNKIIGYESLRTFSSCD